MIACGSPSERDAAETLNTLQYAHRARNIRNRTRIGETLPSDIEFLRAQVVRLKAELAMQREAVARAGLSAFDGEQSPSLPGTAERTNGSGTPLAPTSF